MTFLDVLLGMFSPSAGIHLTAQTLPDLITSIGIVGGPSTGQDSLGVISVNAMLSLIPLINITSIFIIVFTGFLLVISQDENQMQTARKTLAAVVTALVLINVAPFISNALQASGQLNAAGGAIILSDQVAGIVRFFEVSIISLAVLSIIISGIRAIAKFGTGEGVADIRRTVISAIAGAVIIAVKLMLADAVVTTRSPNEVVATIVRIVTVILGFMGLAAVVVIVIAGIMLVVNIGDESVVSRTRGIIIRVLLGLVVIMISAALINIVLI